MPSWISLQHEFQEFVTAKGYTHPEVFRWVVEHIEFFPESRRNRLLFTCSYATSQMLECVTRDAVFTEGRQGQAA
jgi:hypothetical protein